MQSQTDSFRDNYLSSKPLNPEIKQQCPLDFINEQVFEKAYEVKQHLRNRSSFKKSSPHVQSSALSKNDKHLSSHFEKQSYHQRTSQTCTPIKMSIQRKIRIKKQSRRLLSLENSSFEEREPTSEEAKLYGKVTIHVLRQKKHQLEQNMRTYQSQYNYIAHKLDKVRKVRDQAHKHIQKIEQISLQKRKANEQLREAHRIQQQQNRKRNEALRQQVLDQRANRDEAINRRRKQKISQAAQLRNKSTILKCEKHNKDQYESNQKRMEFVRQKINSIQRRNFLNQTSQVRRATAKLRFRNMWLDEFEGVDRAKKQLITKKRQFSSKIQSTIAQINEIQCFECP